MAAVCWGDGVWLPTKTPAWATDMACVTVATVFHVTPSPELWKVQVSPSRATRSQYGASAGALTLRRSDATPSVIVATKTRGDPPS